MKTRLLMLVLCLVPFLVSCKLLKNHVVKATAVPTIEAGAPFVVIRTTKGDVHLATSNLGAKSLELIRSLRPSQCLVIKTEEQFAMSGRQVYFEKFKLQKLLEADSECRKIKFMSGITIR